MIRYDHSTRKGMMQAWISCFLFRFQALISDYTSKKRKNPLRQVLPVTLRHIIV